MVELQCALLEWHQALWRKKEEHGEEVCPLTCALILLHPSCISSLLIQQVFSFQYA